MPNLHFRALLALMLLALAVPAAAAQTCESEHQAVHTVIDQYAQTEAAMDMRGQAALMSADRVHITGQGRMTNQAMNMELQQAQYDALKQMMPGMKQYVDARDRMVHFYGGCDVAVASFTWHLMPVPSGTMTPAQMEMMQAMGGPPPPSAISLVLEKDGGAWKIVHTHASALEG